MTLTATASPVWKCRSRIALLVKVYRPGFADATPEKAFPLSHNRFGES